MRHTIFIFSLLSMSGLTAMAQEGDYRYQDARQLWRTTENAAGLSLDSIENRGWAVLDLEHRSGSFHRIQEGLQRNMLQFRSERYQQIGKYLVGYGRFAFDLDRTKDRAWADVYRPYDANPYYSGSSVAGKYDQQSFDFTGSLGTVALNNWRVGVRLDYKAGDLSRLRDPRSRAQLLEYQLTPSVAYSIKRHTLGLAPYYHRRKEKMPTLKTVQNDPNLSYYEMRGLEMVYGGVGAYSGFNRQWVDHRLGLSLNYGYQSDRLNSLTTISLERGEEDILENEKREPAHYGTRTLRFATLNRIHSGRLLHEIDLNMSYQQAYGDENVQQRMQTTDPVTGVTSYHHETLLTYDKRYQMQHIEGLLRYRMNIVDHQQINGYVGMTAGLTATRQKHLLPTSSFNHQRISITAEGGKALWGERLWIDLSGSYHFSDTKDDDLSLAEPESIFAQEVLLPDMEYYKANYWKGHLQLTWLFPLHIKGADTRWFVRAYGDYLRTDNKLDGKCVGISIGLYN